MKVAYIFSEILAVTSIREMLQEEYGANNLTPIPAHDLKKTDLSLFDMLVLPGCAGEVNPYPLYIDAQTSDYIHDQMKNRGMVLWTDCASTYSSLEQIEYMNSVGELKQQAGWGFIKGISKGPVGGPALAFSKTHRMLDVGIREIFYTAADGATYTANVCYSNGPGLHLTDSETNNPDVSIIARYNTESSPVAAVTKKMGQGLLVSLGVLVQISPKVFSADNNKIEIDEVELHRRDIYDKLSSTNVWRRHFQGTIFDIIRHHYDGITSPSLNPLPVVEPSYV